MAGRPTYTGGRSVYDGQQAVVGTRPTYTGQTEAPAPQVKRGRGGVLGFIGNAAGDIGEAATGLYTGAVELGKIVYEGDKGVLTGDQAAITRANAKLGRVAKAAVKATADTYRPIARGDVRGQLSLFYQHPLYPVLDLLTVLSAGAGGVARAGRALEAAGAGGRAVGAAARLDRPGTIVLRNPATKGAAEGYEPAITELTKPTSARPLRKAAQKAVDAALRAAPGAPGDTIAIARFARELRRSPDLRAQQLRLASLDYTKAFARLSKKERVALQTLGRLPLPKQLAEWKRQLGDVVTAGGPEAVNAEATLKLLTNPDIERLYLNPSEPMLAAHQTADALGTLSSELLGISPEAAQAARFRHARLVSGAVAYTARDARRRITQLDRELRAVGRTTRDITIRAGRLRSRGTPELRQAERARARTYAQLSRAGDAHGRLNAAISSTDQLRQAVEAARGDVERLASGRGLTSDELLAGGLRPGSDLSGVRTRLLGRRYDQYTRLAAQYDRALARVTALQEKLPEVPATGRQTAESAAIAQARADVASRLMAGRAELERLSGLEEQLAGERGLVEPGIVGGPSIDELSAEIAAAGRPQPLYLPDTAQAERRGIFGRGRSATTAPRSPVHRSTGALFRIGQLALEPDVLSPEFLRTVVYSHYVDLHEQLLEAARPVFRGDGLRAGEVYVLRLPGERISYTERTRGAHQRSVEEILPDAKLSTADEGAAVLDHGRRYAVPEKLAKRLEAEYRASEGAAAAFLRKSTTVWRALVLGLRPGFLVNNIVGNHLLYAIRYAGPAGLRAYANAVRREGGESAVKAMLRRQPLPKTLRSEFMRENFPEQVAGTLIDTQLPATRTGRAVRKLSAGLVPLDRAAEQTLRRAAVEASLRRSPEFQQAARELAATPFGKAFPSQTRNFEAAAQKALDENPTLQRQVSQDVNDALGDYLSLSEFEKRTVRAFFPFYAWYRAITLIATRLPLDSPLRASILARVGAIGNELQTEDLGPLPSYLQGSVPLGGDRALRTTGLNPFNTLPALGQAGRALTPGGSTTDVNALFQDLTPFLGGLVKEYKKATDTSYGRSGGTAYGVPGDILAQIIRALPQFRLARAAAGKAPTSRIYTNSALERELSSFLGVPLLTINRAVAAQQARQGR